MNFKKEDLMSRDNIIGIVGRVDFAPGDKPQTTKVKIEYLEEALNILKTLRLTDVYITVVNDSPLLFRGIKNSDCGVAVSPLED